MPGSAPEIYCKVKLYRSKSVKKGYPVVNTTLIPV